METARLRLCPMAAEDVEALLPIFTDPRVMASFGGALFDRAQMERWVQRNLAHQQQYGYGLFVARLKTTALVIGDCGLEQMDVDGTPAAELGYDFRSDYWNRGYATEAASAVRDYALSVLRLPRLISLIRVGNRASARVAEKVGMRRVRTLTRHGLEYWEYGLEAPGRL